MKYILLISLLTIPLFTVIWSCKYGIQGTFSAFYKVIKSKWLFTIVLFITAFPLVIVAANTMFVVAGFLLCVVGVAPQYWLKTDEKMHLIGAVGSILFGITGMLVYWYNWISITLVAAFALFYLFAKIILEIKYSTLYIELIALIIVVFGVWINTNCITIVGIGIN